MKIRLNGAYGPTESWVRATMMMNGEPYSIDEDLEAFGDPHYPAFAIDGQDDSS